VAAEGELGVDVECHRTIDAKALAQRFFSPEEANSIVGLAPPNVDAAFFSCWTRKEAYIKAKGLGLRLPLEQFTVTVDPSAVPRLESSDYAPDDVASYRFWTVPVPDGYSAAMAYCGPADGSLRIFDWRLGE
jgi:4'-phosphopantetheinyl transferase